MSSARLLVFSQEREVPDPWRDWRQEVTRGLEARGVLVHLVLAEEAPPGDRELLRHGEADGRPCTWLRRRTRPVPAFRDLFVSRSHEQALVSLLAELRDQPVIGAMVHRWQGHAATTLARLRQERIPTLLWMADAWPLCPRGDLHAVWSEPCTSARVKRCARCLTATFPEHLQVDGLSAGLGATAERSAEGLVRSLLARCRTDLNLPELLLVPTSRMLAPLADAGVLPSRCHLFPPSLRTPMVAPPAAARAGGATRIGFCGELSPAGGVEVLIDAFQRLPDGFRCELHGPLGSWAGNPAGRARLEAQLRSVPGLSWQRAALGQGFDLLVCPEFFGEPTAATARAALAAGIPVIASETSAARRLVETGGTVFQAGNAVDLAQAITQVAADRERHVPAAPPRTEGDAVPVLEVIRRLALPVAAPSGTSHWSADLAQRVHVVALHPRGRNHVLYPMEWNGDGWSPTAAPRQITSRDLLAPHLEALLAR